MVAICANGPRQQTTLKPLAENSGGWYEDLPAGTFASQGTNVNTALLLIENWLPPKGRSDPALEFVRPAWAHSYGCKSRRELVTTSEVKRNCTRVTECGEEAWIEAAGR